MARGLRAFEVDGNEETSFNDWNFRPWFFGVALTFKHRGHLSHEKNPLTFHYTGCLIGILIMVYCNPHIIG